MELDPDLIFPNKELSLAQGAIHPYQWHTWYYYQLEDLAKRHSFSLNTPVKNFSEYQLKLILYGEGGEPLRYRNRFGRVREYYNGFEGVIPRLERLYRDTESEHSRSGIERYMMSGLCPVCEGRRLKP